MPGAQRSMARTPRRGRSEQARERLGKESERARWGDAGRSSVRVLLRRRWGRPMATTAPPKAATAAVPPAAPKPAAEIAAPTAGAARRLIAVPGVALGYLRSHVRIFGS